MACAWIRGARCSRRPPPPPFTVTYAGHLYPWKGVDVLLHALAELPQVQARIVGGQPGEADHGRLDGLARTLGVGDRVTFTGWLPPASVTAELARAHALILPNTPTHTSERYTSPLKLFEYLAAGRPIVASDLAALREVLRHEDNALLVESGSSTALAAAVRRLMGDRTLASGLATRAFDDAAYYGWETRAQRIDVVLEAARARDMISDALLRLVRCPDCRGTLADGADALTCTTLRPPTARVGRAIWTCGRRRPSPSRRSTSTNRCTPMRVMKRCRRRCFRPACASGCCGVS